MRRQLGEVLASLLKQFLESGGDFLYLPGLLTDRQRAGLVHDVRRVMHHPLEQHVESRRLAFAESDSLTYPTDEQHLERLIHSRTAVLQSLELSNSAIGEVAAFVCEQLGRPTSVSAYISSPHSNAFDWHTDEWDSVVLQLEGVKIFHFSSDPDEVEEEARRQTSVTLNPDDALLFNMNSMHRTTTSEASVHLSMSVRYGHEHMAI
jgi:Cupin superfamily protein